MHKIVPMCMYDNNKCEMFSQSSLDIFPAGIKKSNNNNNDASSHNCFCVFLLKVLNVVICCNSDNKNNKMIYK